MLMQHEKIRVYCASFMKVMTMVYFLIVNMRPQISIRLNALTYCLTL